MYALLQKVNHAVWGLPLLVLILGVGLYLTVRTGFVQIRMFPRALTAFLGQLKGKGGSGGVTPYRALCTALAATVGTGNLAGVAGAIAIGGPGAVFWMWVSAILGMATKFAEATLAVRYRIRNESGELVGGPMYMIGRGLGEKWKWMASVYCFFGVVASFGVGNATQINTVISGIDSMANAYGLALSQPLKVGVGVFLAVLISIMLFGGAKRIGQITEMLVPVISVGYLLLGIAVLVIRAQMLPGALRAIVQGAFVPEAVTGGMIGSAFMALRIGASRGVFTNEAGMGTASIAHGSANVNHPAEQGFMGIMEVFLDTIVICTMTALVILCSGVEIPYGIDTGAALTTQAFCAVCGEWVSIPIAISLCCFAIATVLGWGLYGVRCAQYLFGDQVWKPFVFLQAGVVIVGAVLQTGTVWLLSDIVNGLMAVPNLIALLLLSPELFRLVKTYSSTPLKCS